MAKITVQVEESDKDWLKYRQHLRNEGVTQNRIDKLSQMYRTCKRGLGMELSIVTRQDLEDFVNRINENDFLRQNGEPYTGSSKSDIKKFLKQFFKWAKGGNVDYPDMVRWIKGKIPKDEKPAQKPTITKEEALLLANQFSSNRYKVLTLIAFDSGFRIGELSSMKKKHLTFESFDDQGNKCFWAECTKSKTYPRKVPISLFTKELSDFYNSPAYKTLDDEDSLFSTKSNGEKGKISYESYNKMLKSYGMKLFRKSITPHCLRHSSATLYSRLLEGNMNEITQRYGWSLSSDEAQTYIRTSGAYQKVTAKKVYSNETTILREKLLQQQTELVHQQEKLDRMERLLNRLANRDEFLKELEEMPDE